MGGRRGTLEERFLRYVGEPDPVTGCVPWTGKSSIGRYGSINSGTDGKPYLVHRLAWYLHHGQWPEHTVDHLCENPRCVNVDHLEDVPQAENTRRYMARHGNPMSRRTECPAGHPYPPGGPGIRRRCKTCDNAASRRYRARIRAAATTDKDK